MTKDDDIDEEKSDLFDSNYIDKVDKEIVDDIKSNTDNKNLFLWLKKFFIWK